MGIKNVYRGLKKLFSKKEKYTIMEGTNPYGIKRFIKPIMNLGRGNLDEAPYSYIENFGRAGEPPETSLSYTEGSLDIIKINKDGSESSSKKDKKPIRKDSFYGI